MAASNPFNLHSVTPYLVVNDARSLVSFLEDVLKATLRGELRIRDDGSVMHCEVQIGDSVVMIGEPLDKVAPETSASLYVYVDDCDETYIRALENGAEAVLEPQDHQHGDRYGGFKDLSGNLWWVVTHIGTPE